ncbi:MAG: integrase family protein [Neobacillus sp.]|nr:integrase family protein [Neobacillus sp.]
MNFVQPIRDIEKLKSIEKFLKEKNIRDYIMFLLGIYTGLRISDILRLRVKDVAGNYIKIREKKTGKDKRVPINPILKKQLKVYIAAKPMNEFLIKSRIGKNRPISRTQAYRILKEVADEINLDEIGTHSMRKTFGYHYYQKSKDVAFLQKVFNHAKPEDTLRYIGLDQDSLDKGMNNFRFY